MNSELDSTGSVNSPKALRGTRRYPVLHAVFNPGPHIRRATAGFREPGWWKSVAADLVRPGIPVLPFVPRRRQSPERVLPVYSAWRGIESILGDILERFEIGRETCLEFGVERGYSTAAFSCFFNAVTGVDTFEGDEHTRFIRDFYAETSASLANYSNIKLFKCDYRDWIARDQNHYNLIHVDIVHSYSDTFACGLWSARHADCVLFHDTVSYPTVKRAVLDIARLSGRRFYNFKESNGLGILV